MYSDPNYATRREYSFNTLAGAATESAVSKFRSYQKIKLKRVHASVITAGTATTHALTVKVGTTSVGLITLGTSTAGAVASSQVINADVAAMQQISVTSGADATGVAGVVYEYEVQHDAVQTP